MYTEENKDDLKNGSRRSRSRSRDKNDSKASADPDAQCALKMRGIPWSCEEGEIYEFFEGYKLVEDSVKIHVYEGGRKSGMAMVLFETVEECLKAQAQKEGEKIGNRWINLTPARNSEHEVYLDDPQPMPERPPPPTESDVIFCVNLQEDTTEEMIKEFFEAAAPTTRIHRPDGRPFAFVEFATFEDAAKAMEELAEAELNGACPRLGLSRPKRKG